MSISVDRNTRYYLELEPLASLDASSLDAAARVAQARLGLR